MIEGRALLTFLGAGLALLITPGPAVLYIAAQSVRGGFRAGFVSCLGLLTGGAIHLTMAVVGLAVLLGTSPAALNTIRLAGAAYLGWLALREVMRALRPTGASLAGRAPDSDGSLYRQGVLVNVLNPKAPMFFLAFLPQFVRAEAGPAWAQLTAFGLLFLAMGFCTDTSWAWVSSRAGAVLRSRLGGTAAASAGHWLSAAVYAALALAVALSGHR